MEEAGSLISSSLAAPPKAGLPSEGCEEEVPRGPRTISPSPLRSLPCPGPCSPARFVWNSVYLLFFFFFLPSFLFFISTAGFLCGFHISFLESSGRGTRWLAGRGPWGRGVQLYTRTSGGAYLSILGEVAGSAKVESLGGSEVWCLLGEASLGSESYEELWRGCPPTHFLLIPQAPLGPWHLEAWPTGLPKWSFSASVSSSPWGWGQPRVRLSSPLSQGKVLEHALWPLRVRCVPCRLRKLDPEEEDDPFSNYEVPSEAKLENFPSVGPHRLSFDSATFMESGRTQAPRAVL